MQAESAAHTLADSLSLVCPPLSASHRQATAIWEQSGPLRGQGVPSGGLYRPRPLVGHLELLWQREPRSTEGEGGTDDMPGPGMGAPSLLPS